MYQVAQQQKLAYLSRGYHDDMLIVLRLGNKALLRSKLLNLKYSVTFKNQRKVLQFIQFNTS